MASKPAKPPRAPPQVLSWEFCLKVYFSEHLRTTQNIQFLDKQQSRGNNINEVILIHCPGMAKLSKILEIPVANSFFEHYKLQLKRLYRECFPENDFKS